MKKLWIAALVAIAVLGALTAWNVARVSRISPDPEWWCGPRLCDRDQAVCESHAEIVDKAHCTQERRAFCALGHQNGEYCFSTREKCEQLKAGDLAVNATCVGVE